MIYLLVSLDTRCHSYFIKFFLSMNVKLKLSFNRFSGCKYKTLLITNNDFFYCFLKKNYFSFDRGALALFQVV